MENLTRKLAKNQLTLMNEVRASADINIVNCGHCGTLLLHKRKEESIVCWSCKRDMNLSDCPDYLYDGCLENKEFNDEPKKVYKNKVTKSSFLNWYFADIDVMDSVTKNVIDDLERDGKTTITARQLFDDCGYIPQFICEIDGDDEYNSTEVEFIED